MTRTHRPRSEPLPISGSQMTAERCYGPEQARQYHADLKRSVDNLPAAMNDIHPTGTVRARYMTELALPTGHTIRAIWDGGRFVYFRDHPDIDFSEVRGENWANHDDMLWSLLAMLAQEDLRGYLRQRCLSFFPLASVPALRAANAK